MAYLLDGDNLRHGLNGNLGFSAEDRAENVRRTAQVARLFADSGAIALVSLVSPYARDRVAARELHAEQELDFVEVYVNTPLEECERRDPKGLYARARRGEISRDDRDRRSVRGARGARGRRRRWRRGRGRGGDPGRAAAARRRGLTNVYGIDNARERRLLGTVVLELTCIAR